MTENQKKILEMLAQDKINTEEAYRLLNAIGPGEGDRQAPPKDVPRTGTKPRFLRVTVTPGEGESGAKGSLFQDGNVGRVNIRVPLSLIRAGMKLTSLIPPSAYEKINGAMKEKGIDFDLRSIKPEDLEDLIDALGDMQIDVEGGKGEKVKVFAE